MLNNFYLEAGRRLNVEYEIPDSTISHIWTNEQLSVIKEEIQAFENTLDNDEDIGIYLTQFGQSFLMYVTQISCKSPVLLKFKGKVNGEDAILLQHVNQLNFLLTKVKRVERTPRIPIGFY